MFWGDVFYLASDLPFAIIFGITFSLSGIFVNVKKSLCQGCEVISLMHIWEKDKLLFVGNERLRHATVPEIKRNSFCVECWQTELFLWINMLMILLGTLHNKMAALLLKVPTTQQSATQQVLC